jgi:uncharacterized protein
MYTYLTRSRQRLSNLFAPQFGLPAVHAEQMHSVFAKYSDIEKVVVFGSRAIGNWKAGSDVDVALFGVNGSPVSAKTLENIRFALAEEGTLPYAFDIVDYATITHEALKEHIDAHGVIFYAKSLAF